MAQRTIRFRIRPDGRVEETVEGVAGVGCEQLTGRIEARLGTVQQRRERLVELRRRECYVAEFRPDPDGQGWLMSEFHCSVMKIAEQFPCVCDQELQLIRHTFPDCHVERVHWLLEGGHACGFRLQPHVEPEPEC